MTIPPMEPYASDETLLLALAIWREARNQPHAAKLGVAHVIRNRCAMAPAQGFHSSISANVLKPWAFSSFNQGDPNSAKYPRPDDSSWIDSLAAARSAEPDPTGAAVFYFSPPLSAPPHAWGEVEYTARIGQLSFYRIPNWNPPTEMVA